MSDVLKVDVDVSVIAIQERLQHVITPSAMLEIHNTLAKMCDPYVPFLNGPLSQTVIVMPDYIQYIQPYAHYQYEGIHFKHTLDFHPLASAQWDKAMLRDHREEFVQQVKDILVRRAQELYG